MCPGACLFPLPHPFVCDLHSCSWLPTSVFFPAARAPSEGEATECHAQSCAYLLGTTCAHFSWTLPWGALMGKG